MQFSKILLRVKDISKVSNKDDLLKESIQTGFNIATSQDLPYLMSESTIELIAPVTAGTIAITNGTKAVAGTSTSFTSAMVGRKIRIAGDNTYYKIATFTNSTTITLEENFQESTVTAATYSIFKDEYRLPADLDNYKVFRQVKNQQSIVDVEPTAFDIFEPSPTSQGSPDFSILMGSKLDTDSTGTVAGTTGNSTITGTNTTWTTLEGLGTGSKITVGIVVFTVKSVDGDTSITTYENIPVDFTGSTYTILLDNLLIQFFQIPDTAELIRFRYQRIAYILVDDQDIPDLPDQYHYILVTAGLIWAWATKDKEESRAQQVIFDKQVRSMWKKIGHQSKNRLYPRLPQVGLLDFPFPPRFDSNVGTPFRLPL